MAIRAHALTYADLERERVTRDERLELIAGEIVVTPSPTPMHQIIQQRLAFYFQLAIVETKRGVVMTAPLDVYLDDQSVLQPDLVVLLRDRRDLFGPRKIEGAPNLVVEILSPSTSGRDRTIKRDLYARHQVPEFWLVDPDERSITIYSDMRDNRYQRLETPTTMATSATITGVSIDLATLFSAVWGE